MGMDNKIYSFFKDITSNDQSACLKNTAELVSFLKEKQTVFQNEQTEFSKKIANVEKEYHGLDLCSLVSKAEDSDISLNESTPLDCLLSIELSYALKRLIRGLSSSHNSASLRFSVALSHLLAAFPWIPNEFLLERLFKYTNMSREFLKKSEKNEFLLARHLLFSIISQRLNSNQTSILTFIVQQLDEYSRDANLFLLSVEIFIELMRDHAEEMSKLPSFEQVNGSFKLAAQIVAKNFNEDLLFSTDLQQLLSKLKFSEMWISIFEHFSHSPSRFSHFWHANVNGRFSSVDSCATSMKLILLIFQHCTALIQFVVTEKFVACVCKSFAVKKNLVPAEILQFFSLVGKKCDGDLEYCRTIFASFIEVPDARFHSLKPVQSIYSSIAKQFTLNGVALSEIIKEKTLPTPWLCDFLIKLLQSLSSHSPITQSVANGSSTKTTDKIKDVRTVSNSIAIRDTKMRIIDYFLTTVLQSTSFDSKAKVFALFCAIFATEMTERYFWFAYAVEQMPDCSQLATFNVSTKSNLSEISPMQKFFVFLLFFSQIAQVNVESEIDDIAEIANILSSSQNKPNSNCPDEENPPIDVFVDLLLACLSNHNVYLMRIVVEDVFSDLLESFGPLFSLRTLSLLTEPLFSNSNENTEDDEIFDDLSEIPNENTGDFGKNMEVSSDDMEVSSDDMEVSNDDMEVSHSAKSDLSDDEMCSMDVALAQVFAVKKAQLEQKKTTQLQNRTFQIKIISMLNVFIRKIASSNASLFLQSLPSINSTFKKLSSSSNAQLSSLSHSVKSSVEKVYSCKKCAAALSQIEDAELLSALDCLLKNKLAEESVIFVTLIVRTLLRKSSPCLAEILNRYEGVFSEWYSIKNNKINFSIFKTISTNFSASKIAVQFLVFLQESLSNEKLLEIGRFKANQLIQLMRELQVQTKTAPSKAIVIPDKYTNNKQLVKTVEAFNSFK